MYINNEVKADGYYVFDALAINLKLSEENEMDNNKNEINNDDMPRLDVSKIPPHVRRYLADATMELLRGILSTPEGREKFEKKKAELKAQGRL